MPTGVRYGNDKRSDSQERDDEEDTTMDDESNKENTGTRATSVQMQIDEEAKTCRNKVDIQAAMALAALTGPQVPGVQQQTMQPRYMQPMQAADFLRQQQQQQHMMSMMHNKQHMFQPMQVAQHQPMMQPPQATGAATTTAAPGQGGPVFIPADTAGGFYMYLPGSMQQQQSATSAIS